MKNCKSTRGYYTCLEVEFIFSRMGTILPEDIDDLIKYDETKKPNAWYEAETWDAEKCYNLLLRFLGSEEIVKVLPKGPESNSLLRTLADNGCGTLAWDNAKTEEENWNKILGRLPGA